LCGLVVSGRYFDGLNISVYVVLNVLCVGCQNPEPDEYVETEAAPVDKRVLDLGGAKIWRAE
jgi:hypothetical protein